jgi:hypothetical protein
MTGYTAFITYELVSLTGYCQSIHCNYIKKINLGTANPYTQTINLNFPNTNDFRFLSSDLNIINTQGTGFTANEIYAIVQIVDNSNFLSEDEIKPDSTLWKKYDMTSQISGYVDDLSFFLTPSNLTSLVFKIPLLDYNNINLFALYDLAYLNYHNLNNSDEFLSFGDETFFFGNVSTQIKADVYTTDINIFLSLNEFNSTTNKTWNGNETVYISEIGIYDSNYNLVAIGKLNNPVAKDATISRTIMFELDF